MIPRTTEPINVTDMDASIAFYISLTEGSGIESRDGSRARITTPRGHRIELERAETVARRVIVFRSDELEAVIERMNEAGTYAPADPFYTGWHTLDPSGHVVAVLATDQEEESK